MPPRCTQATLLDKQAATRLILARVERGHVAILPSPPLPRKIPRGNLWALLTRQRDIPGWLFSSFPPFFLFSCLGRNLGKTNGWNGEEGKGSSLGSLIYRVLRDLWLNIIFLGRIEGGRDFSSWRREFIKVKWNFSWKFCTNEFDYVWSRNYFH